MTRKTLYLAVAAGVAVLFALVVWSALANSLAIVLVALGALAAGACLMLVEQRRVVRSTHHAVGLVRKRLAALPALMDDRARSSQIATLRDEIRALERQLAATEELRSEIGVLNHQVATIGGRLTAVDGRLTAFQGRLTAIDAQLAPIGELREHAQAHERAQEQVIEGQKSAAEIDRRFHSEVRRSLTKLKHEPLVIQIAAQLELHDRFSPRAPLAAAGAWALSPVVTVDLVDTVVRKAPDLVVECGSGISSIWLGYAVREAGRGRVLALEHHEKYLEQTRRMVALHGLDDVVEIVHTPLVPVTIGDETWSWYDAPLERLHDIGVLLVDGPPAATGESARYPALPLLRERLVDGAVIVLDDIVRADEQGVVERWLTEDETLERAYTVLGEAVVLSAGRR
jgi:predicted O-methyltransferase YrrM